MGGAFLSGLLGAAGQDIEKQSDRRYQEKRQERADRMQLLSLAAANPHVDQNQLPLIFQELDDLAKDSGYKSENKGVKDPFTQMGRWSGIFSRGGSSSKGSRRGRRRRGRMSNKLRE